MGGNCTKGSKTRDPDNSPYAPTDHPGQEGGKKSKKSSKKEKNGATGAKAKTLDTSADLNAEVNPPSAASPNFESEAANDVHDLPKQTVTEDDQATKQETDPGKLEAAKVSLPHDVEKTDGEPAVSIEVAQIAVDIETKPPADKITKPASLDLKATEDPEKAKSRPSALPVLSSPKSPKQPASPTSPKQPASPTSPKQPASPTSPKQPASPSGPLDSPLDANTVIQRVKSKTKDGKYADLVGSEETEAVLKSPTRNSASPDRESGLVSPSQLPKPVTQQKTEPAAQQPAEPVTSRTEPMAILSSLSYLKTQGEKEAAKEPESPTKTSEVKGKVLAEVKSPDKGRQPHEFFGRSSVTKRHLETLPEIETSAPTHEHNGAHAADAGSAGKVAKIDQGALPGAGTTGEKDQVEEDEDSSMQTEEIDLHIEESPRTERPTEKKFVNGADFSLSSVKQAVQVEDVVMQLSPTSPGGHQIPAIYVSEEHSATASLSSSRSSLDTSKDDVIHDTTEDIKMFCLEHLPDESSINSSIAARHEFCRGTRSRAIQMVDRFVDGEEACSPDEAPVVIVTGAAGMGKSSLMRELSTTYALQLAASYFFCSTCSKLEHNYLHFATLACVRTIIQRVDSYAEHLPTIAEIKAAMVTSSAIEILDTLILKPFHNNPEFSERKRLVLLLDAVDECEDHEEIVTFANYFKTHAPPWFVLVLSVRNDNAFLSQFQASLQVELKPNTSDNMQDMTKILKSPLEAHIDKISLNTAVSTLAKKTHGVPLTANLYKRLLGELNRQITIREVSVETIFPTGLEGIIDFAVQKFKKHSQTSADVVSSVLSALALAREALPHSVFQACKLKDMESLKELSLIADVTSAHIQLLHPFIATILLSSEKNATELNFAGATHAMSKYCLQWLEPVLNEDAKPVAMELTTYAVKHGVSHMIDSPGNSEHVGKALCSLSFINYALSEKLLTVESLQRLHHHVHNQHTKDQKQASVQAYLSKSPDILEKSKAYYEFLSEYSNILTEYPVSIWQLGSNYASHPKLQASAKDDIAKNPWIEDLKALPKTRANGHKVPPNICGFDMSPDGKFIAMLTKESNEEKDMNLSLFALGSMQETTINLAQVEGASGHCCKFLLDSSAVFVGSLTHMVNTKGAVVPAGLNASPLQIKEKFEVECCDVSPFHLIVSLTTFPFGGRSAYLAIFSIKDKSLVSLKEILTFKFGASPNFGVHCCSIKSTKKLVAACVKQTKKAQMKVTIWDSGNWNVLHETILDGDRINFCQFAKGENLILEVSTRSQEEEQNHVFVWNYAANSPPQRLNPVEYHSTVMRGVKTQLLIGSWKFKCNQMIIRDLDLENLNTLHGYRVIGADPSSHVNFSKTHIASANNEQLTTFQWSDVKEGDVSKLHDFSFEGILFVPKSNTGILLHTAESDPGYLTASLYTLELNGNDVVINKTAVKDVQIPAMTLQKNSVFSGSKSNLFGASSDGKHAILYTGDGLKVLDVSKNTTLDITIPVNAMAWATNPKDASVAVLCNSSPMSVNTYDVNAGVLIQELSLDINPKGDVQFSFISTNGNIITYLKNGQDNLKIWNIRSAELVHSDSMNLQFCQISPSSDRLALSIKQRASSELRLRSSDGKFSTVLHTPGQWSGTSDNCDVAFSEDGTVVVGIDFKTSLCRVWNGGNGEVLRDIAVEFMSKAFIGGMLTNTHVVVFDGRVLVFDIATGVLICAQTLTQNICRRSFAISPRGQLLAAIKADHSLMLFRQRNFDSAKRKTTLQRMKSFS